MSKNTTLYLAVAYGSLVNNFPDAAFPKLAGKFPKYNLSLDGNGEPVKTLVPNASLNDRIMFNYLADAPIYNTPSTCANVIANVWSAKKDVFPSKYKTDFHIIPIKFELDEHIEDFSNEIKTLRLAVDQATGSASVFPEGTLLTLDQITKNFEQKIISE